MKHLLRMAGILAVAALLARNKVPSTPWGYDEADYMFAASLGPAANWFDTGTMPLTEFIHAGTSRGSDPKQKAALSAKARAADDPVAYRHWHGPLYYYWLGLAAHGDERTTRALGFLIPAAAAVALYFGSLWALGGVGGQIAAVLAAAMFLWSPVTLKTSELAPHLLFEFLCLAMLMLLAKAGGGRTSYYAAAACAGLAFCTMEVAFVPILVLGIFAWLRRVELRTDVRMLGTAAGILVGTVLAVWPSGLLKLSFSKAYMVMAYLAVFRKGAWGNVTFFETWERRFAITPVEWVLFAAALALWFVRGRRRGPGVFLLFAGLMILATIKVYAEGPRYMIPFFGAVQVFTAWVLAEAFSGIRRAWAATAAVCVVLAVGAQRGMATFLLHENPGPARALAALRANGLAEKRILASKADVPTLHFYLPKMRVIPYSDAAELAEDEKAGGFDAVLYPDYSLRVTASGNSARTEVK